SPFIMQHQIPLQQYAANGSPMQPGQLLKYTVGHYKTAPALYFTGFDLFGLGSISQKLGKIKVTVLAIVRNLKTAAGDFGKVVPESGAYLIQFAGAYAKQVVLQLCQNAIAGAKRAVPNASGSIIPRCLDKEVENGLTCHIVGADLRPDCTVY